ncbi:MAG: hypothetical protein V1901_03750 [Patescibacteria group bacterium]
MSKCRKFIIAESLKEWSQNSTTEFIEEAKDNELIKKAKEKNILIPSPDLSIFKTIYCKIGEKNKNGVILNKDAVEKGLVTLIGKQININHTSELCGFVLDTKIEKDFVIIYGCFYKSLFQEKFEEFKKLFAEKKLYVSFEIWSTDEKGNSVIKTISKGVKEISPIVFSGVGLLFNIAPACKEAIVEKIFAHKEVKDRTLEDNIIYATKNTNEECISCNQCGSKKEGGENKKMADIIEEVKKKDGYPCDLGDGVVGEIHIDSEGKESKLTAETHKKLHEEPPKAEVIPEVPITAEAIIEPVKPEEVKPEIVAEVKPIIAEAPKVVVKVTEEYTSSRVDTYVNGTASGKAVSKSHSKTTKEYSDGTKDVVENDYDNESFYTYAQLEEKIKLAKEEKDKEIATLKAEQVNIVTVEINKKETIIAEKDKEISKMQQELGIKNQEIAKLTPAPVLTKPAMEVGSVSNGIDEIEARAKKVDEIIARKYKK